MRILRQGANDFTANANHMPEEGAVVKTVVPLVLYATPRRKFRSNDGYLHSNFEDECGEGV
jgi:hypothetical protein